MSDLAEIANLVSKLAMGVDDRDLEVFEECWVDDCYLEVRMPSGEIFSVSGKDKLREFSMARWVGDTEPLHVVSVPNIKIDGNTAQARYFSVYPTVAAKAGPLGVGRYKADVRKGADGQWRVVKQFLHMYSHPSDAPLNDSARAVL